MPGTLLSPYGIGILYVDVCMGKAQGEKVGGTVEMQNRFSLYDTALVIHISIDKNHGTIRLLPLSLFYSLPHCPYLEGNSVTETANCT